MTFECFVEGFTNIIAIGAIINALFLFSLVVGELLKKKLWKLNPKFRQRCGIIFYIFIAVASGAMGILHFCNWSWFYNG